MPLPYTFGTQTGTIPLNELDENFTYLEQLVPPLATSAVTVTASAQPNVRSLGTLTSLSCTGTITSGTVTANLINGTLQTSSQTNITAVGTLSSLTVSGSLNGTLSTAAQPNITSLGILSSLSVSGNMSGNNVTASGTANVANLVVTGAGTFGTTLGVTGNITGGNVIATNFVGSGTQLTGISGPAFSAIQTSPQVIPIAPTNLTLLFQTEELDSFNCFDTSNGRFTPPVAGWYQINASVQVFPTDSLSNIAILIRLGKNGSVTKLGSYPGINGFQPISTLNCLVYLNGTTDYIYCDLFTTAALSVFATSGSGVSTYFQGHWVRS